MSSGASSPGTPPEASVARAQGYTYSLSSVCSSSGASRPGTPSRGLLHDSPLDSRVQGLCPLTPEPPHTSCERWHLSPYPLLFPRAHGVCRLPKAPPPACLPGRELTGSATLCQWTSRPSTARRMEGFFKKVSRWCFLALPF